MSVALLQIFLCLTAGLALWKMWRAFAGEESLVRYLVAAGFVLRAISGAALFWISWLKLPIARSLQMDHGLWFFALDGRRYFLAAADLADAAPWVILTYPRTGISASYVQTLSVFTYLFGRISSVAILLNLFCYLGMCLIILKWLKSSEASRVPGLVALAGVSLLPSAMLWSVAPLKDTLFQFLIVCIFAAGALWQRAWRGRPSVWAIVAPAAVMIVALFAITGIRWYFGFAVLAASALFFLLTAAISRKKLLAGIAGLATLFLLSQALVHSAASYLPRYLHRVLVPWDASVQSPDSLSVAALSRDLTSARRGFESAGGATSIGIGKPLAKLDAGRRIVPAAAPVTESDWKRADAKAAVAAAVAPVAPVPATPVPVTPVPAAPVPVAPVPIAPVPIAPVQPPATAQPPATPPHDSGDAQEIVVPESTAGRIFAGAVAVLVPSAIARNLGLLEIGGGRGLWWFTDIDTIVFDLVVLFTIVFTIRRLRWATPRNPLFWFVLALAAVGVPLVYTVTNYGTLFRLRIMIFLAVAFIPLALSAASTAKPDHVVPGNTR